MVWRGHAFAAAGEGVEEGVGMGAGLTEAIAAAQLVRAALGRGEGRQVGLDLDPLAAVVAAGMARDLGGPVEDPDLGVRTPRASAGRRIRGGGME